MLGLNMKSHMTEEAATEMPIVDEYIVRKKPIPFNFSFASKAKEQRQDDGDRNGIYYEQSRRLHTVLEFG